MPVWIPIGVLATPVGAPRVLPADGAAAGFTLFDAQGLGLAVVPVAGVGFVPGVGILAVGLDQTPGTVGVPVGVLAAGELSSALGPVRGTHTATVGGGCGGP